MVILICGHPVIAIYNRLITGLIRLYALCSLIFFSACQSTNEQDITIQWNGKRATGLAIPYRFIDGVATDSIDQLISVRLVGQQTPMAGQFQQTEQGILFEPLVPFTRGRSYAVWLRDRRLHEFTLPALDANDKPALLAIYPSSDLLPDNLLKIYLHFSRPMREGQSQKYVALLHTKGDTLRETFLDLQPELWNADRTMLTLWLDPGRIKRDLQPNKRLGAPLQVDGQYQLAISGSWPDEMGATLGKNTIKTFRAVQRDSLSPNPLQWSVHAPKAGTTQPLQVNFGESLDYYLLTETLHILDESGIELSGTWQIGEKEQRSQFKPSTSWTAGRYKLRVESRLEDLAGNNLNRPFDRDITKSKRPDDGRPFKELVFQIRP